MTFVAAERQWAAANNAGASADLGCGVGYYK